MSVSPSPKVSLLRIHMPRLIVLLVLVLLSGGFGQAQAAGIALVQHKGIDAGTTTTSTLSFATPNTAGNFIAVVIRGGLSNSQVFTVKDTNSNIYKQAKQIGSSGSAVTSAIYYAENIAGGANTITVTMTVSGPLRFAILEYSGVATSNSLDAAVAASATSTSPNSGNLTTTTNGDLLLGEVATADSTTFTGGAGFTVRDFVPAEPNTKIITEDQIQAAAGTLSASATLNPSSNWAALLAAFKPAGGVAAPSIASLSPTSGPVGTSVTISGSNFGASQGTSTVTFNGTTATPTSWSATSIVVPVPSGATSGNVVVTVGGVPSNAVGFTVLVPPSITSLSPSSGPLGTAVTITGANFGATQAQGNATITLNGASLPVTNWSDTSIATFVPNGASSGNVVVTARGLSSNGVLFTVTPNINSLSPTSGPAGTPVTISGANFGSSQGTSSVAFNSSTAVVTSWSNTSIVAIVPSNLSPYTNVGVQVIVSGVATLGPTFAITPSIASLSPTSGPAGTSITITGTNFTGVQGAVTFNGTTAAPTSWNSTSIVVPVPAGATTGNVVVTVSGFASSGVPFTVIPTPTISGVNPTSGPVGTSVTITGTNFGAPQGASAVMFSGIAATPSSWNATSIVVPVPTGATTGNVVVTVGGVASSGATFTVIPPSITNLSSASGPIGTSVTITGTNFGAIQGTSVVRFNGTVAPPTSWSDTSIVVPVPSGATTGNIVVTVGALSSNSVPFTVVAPPTISSLSLNVGSVGTSVTVSGTNFGPAQGSSTVTFNGTLATPTSWNGTDILVTVPLGATTGNVVVTVNGLSSNGAPFTVNPISVSVSPTTVTLGTGGQQIFSFTVQNDSLGNGVTWALSGAGCSGAACGTIQPFIGGPGEVYNAPAVAPNPSTVTLTATSVTDPTKSASATITVNQTVPNITALSPTSGPAGTTVSITGTNFGPSPGTSTVTFNGTAASPTNWSPTSIIVIVPSGATTGNVVVTVGGFSSNGVAFTVTNQPNITGISPALGPVGTSVTITGTNFGASQGTSTVTFSAVAGTPASWSATTIVVLVPAGVAAGSSPVIVVVGGVASSQSAFVVTPRITSLNPSSGPIGTSVTVSGSNFGASQGSSSVTFNGTSASPTTWSDTNIVVPVPSGATTGSLVVTVGPGSISSASAPFTVTATITNLFPNSGLAGTNITISGINFGATQGTSTVTFNGVPATAITWSNTSIFVQVPPGASTGNVVVNVGGSASNGVLFTVPPNIASLSPTSAPVGNSVTITGTNFGASQGTSTVAFNGTPATPTSWSNASIVVPVPTGATTGNVVVTVNGFASNGVPFGVAPSITILSPTAGPVGTSVALTGTNFGAAQGTSTVTFNGVAATPTFWSTTTIAVPVPTGATTGNVVVTVGGLTSNAITFTITAVSVSVTPTTFSIPATVSTNFSYNVQNDPQGQGATWSLSGPGCSGGACGALYSTPTSNITGYIAPSVVPNPPTVILTATSVLDPTKSANATITVLPPPANISSLNPVSGPVGTSVTIAGSNFGASQGTSVVNFNGATGSPTNWSNTNIVVPVPIAALSGNVTVAVNNFQSNPVSFSVQPIITSLNPSSGSPGTSVTITGTGFGASQGTSTVTFNGVAATPTSWSATSIVAPVPAGATSGNVVVVAGGVATSGTPFTVTAAAPITLVQHVGKDAGTATTTTLAFASANAAGNFIAVVIRGGNSSAQVFTVRDSNSNTYKQAKQLASSGSAVTSAIYYAENVKSGANTVTVTMSVSGPLRIDILEYSGVAASNSLDATVAATTTSTSPNTGSLTTTANGDLLLAEVSTADSTTFTAGSGYAIRDFVPAEPNTKLITEDQIQSTAGTASASATLNPSSNWGAILAAFKAAGGTGGGAGTPASIAATSGTPQSATVNTAFSAQLQATVKDSLNNPVGGVTVTFTAPGSGASGTFAGGVNTATTNSLGLATSAVFTANSTAGTYALTASASGVGTSANFSLTNLAGSAANISAAAGTSQSAVINTAFATQLQATVTDSQNNPVSGVTVTFTAPGSGASGTFAGGVNTATTNAQGIATAPAFTANSTVGGPYTVTASASGVATQANFSLTNLLAAANITLVQHKGFDSAQTTSNSLAFSSTTTPGNFIAVAIRGGLSNSQVFTVTDSSGNTYHQAFRFGLTSAPDTIALFYAENINGGPDIVTVTQSVFAPLRFAILEYSGVATSNSLDGTPATSQGSTTTPSTGNMTTSVNGDLLLAVMITQNGASFTPGSGYTIEESVPAAPNTKLIAEDRLQNTAGTVLASASLAASDIWGAGLAAFRSMSGGVLPISVSVSPSTVSLPSGYGTQNFTATVNNDFHSSGATWALSGAGCSGAACGTLSRVTITSVTYTAPSNIPSPATVTLTATSIGDNTKSASATITVTPGVLTVVLSPKRAAVTLSSSPVQFAANVFNDPSNAGVTWQVDGNNGGSSASGTVSPAGLYTPGTQPGQHTITAISNASASVSGSALIAVTDLAGVYTHHNDNGRTGQNLKEYGLTPATVNDATFGQLFSCPVDGYVYAQPLWVANLNFGGTKRNVVFIATEHDTVYAFDADSPSCVQLWKVNFLGAGVTTLTSADVASNTDIVPEIGITSTPVIDPVTNTLYVVPKTRETVGTVSGQACSTGAPCYVHRLHALDLITGSEKFGGPVVVTATNFSPLKQMQRPALLLANNTLYLAFGSHGDQCPYQGWVIAYNPATLAQTFATALSDTTSGCNQGAIWLSGAGPSTDASGNVYVVTGNGLYDGSLNFGDSVVKLSPTGSILDWFTPFNQATLAANDVDLGSAAVLILPDSAGSAAHPHLAVTTSKTAVVYLLDQANLGKFNSSASNDVQEVIPIPPMNTTLNDGGNYVGPAYWNGNLYLTGQNYPLTQFQISNGVISTPQFATSTSVFPPRGGVPAISANGATGGVLWIIDYSGWQNNVPAILDAFDANNIGTLLYSSPANGSGAASNGVKFTVPTVANGKVYVAGQLSFTVYGLLPN